MLPICKEAGRMFEQDGGWKMKALEILKRLQNSDYFDRSKLKLSKEYTLENAIAELEALQQPKSCDGCTTLPFVLTELAKKNGGKCGTCKRFVKDNFQPKE